MDILDRSGVTDVTKDTEDETAETVTREDLAVFNDYFIEVSTALLGLDSHDYFNKLVQTEENLNKIMAFVTNKQNRTLIVSKTEEFSKVIESKEERKIDAQEGAEEDIIMTEGESQSKSIVNIEIDLKVNYRGEDAQSIAFIKRQLYPIINLKEGKKAIGRQLQVINLGYAGEEIELFRMANIYLDNGLIPLFTSYKSKKNQDDTIYSHIDEIEQLLSKLRMEFIHCSQDQLSYDVKLVVDQRIMTKKEKALAEGRELREDDFDEEMKDPSFHESLFKYLKIWTKDIQKVAYLRTDFPIDSVLTEITFWKNREHALQNIQDQLNTEEIKLALSLLTNVPGMSVKVLSFQTDINVVHELKKAQEYNLILKDSPINSLISATDLKSVLNSIVLTFNHFKTLRSSNSYPIKRVLEMLEAFSRDVTKQMIKILEDVNLMSISNTSTNSNNFTFIREDIQAIFMQFDQDLKKFMESIKNKYPKRQERKLLTKKLDMEHSVLEIRLNEISNQRTENEKLLEIILSVQDEDEGSNKEAIKDIKDAYTVFLPINVLDISIEGTKKWNNAKKEYNIRIDRVEEEITSQMRDRLASAKSTNEMFKTFSRFNALFSRPRIRDAFQEYQNQILSSIQKDIKSFRDKFNVKYNSSEVSKVYKIRNFPSLAGFLTWNQQLSRKLRVYQDRIKDVLGAGWERHVVGKQLQQRIEPIAKHLEDSQDAFYHNWLQEMTNLNVFGDKNQYIFRVVTKSDGKKRLEVNFSEKGLSLYREKNNLRYVGRTMPYSLIHKSQEVQI
jgi:dynein heavy chain 1